MEAVVKWKHSAPPWAGAPGIFQAVLDSEHGGVCARNSPAAEARGPGVMIKRGFGGEHAPSLHYEHASVVYNGHSSRVGAKDLTCKVQQRACW